MIVAAPIRHRITVIAALFYFAVMALHASELAVGAGSIREHVVVLVAMAAWLPMWWLAQHIR
jgi:hypothetical protein